PGCLAVVTSRDQLAGLVATVGARPLALDLLTAADARELLARRLGADRAAGEPAAVEAIVAACARLPLALTITAARAATSPGFPLAAVAAELHESGSALDPFGGGDLATDVRAVFSWSYHALSAGAARLFRLLGLHPGPGIPVAAAASLARLSPGPARALLAELTRVHLLAEHLPGRYALHDLLRAYACELACAQDSESDRHAAIRRVLDHYLHTAHSAGDAGAARRAWRAALRISHEVEHPHPEKIHAQLRSPPPAAAPAAPPPPPPPPPPAPARLSARPSPPAPPVSPPGPPPGTPLPRPSSKRGVPRFPRRRTRAGCGPASARSGRR